MLEEMGPQRLMSRGQALQPQGSQNPTGLLAPGPPVTATPSPILCLLPTCPPICSILLLNQLQRVGETGPVTAVSSVLLLVLRYKSRFHAGVPRGS